MRMTTSPILGLVTTIGLRPICTMLSVSPRYRITAVFHSHLNPGRVLDTFLKTDTSKYNCPKHGINAIIFVQNVCKLHLFVDSATTVESAGVTILRPKLI